MDNNQNNYNQDMNNQIPNTPPMSNPLPPVDNQIPNSIPTGGQVNPPMDNQVPNTSLVVEEKKKSMVPIIIIAIIVVIIACIILFFTLGKKTEPGDETNPPVDNKPQVNINGNNCSYDGQLVDKAEYVNGQYKYDYKADLNGWHVELADKKSTDPVNTKFCKYINSVPVVSFYKMFANSKVTSVDFSSFDTENVTDMSWMFYETKIESLDLSSFNTANVTNMSAMFSQMYYLKTLDLSNFNTSNVTDMSHMFNHCQAEVINVSSFDTSNVTNMQYMFCQAERVKELDLSSFDTSKVQLTSTMFLLQDKDAVIYINKDKWTLEEKVTKDLNIQYK